MGDHRGQLGGQGHQEGFFPFLEQPDLFLLHHQHPQGLALVDDGRAEERLEGVFMGFGQVFELGVVLGVGQVDQLFLLADKADDALPQRDLGMAHRLDRQAVGGGEQVGLFQILAQINGAAVHMHGFAGLLDQFGHGFVEIGAGRHPLNDFPQFL
jgi:hypothetical protein